VYKVWVHRHKMYAPTFAKWKTDTDTMDVSILTL
jgi:hypothetical protein